MKTLTFFLVIAIYTIFSIGCNDAKNGVTSGEEQIYVQEIGPAGGTVKDPENPDSASVIIPAGALDVTTSITITTLGASKVAGTIATPFLGGATFGPDGTDFKLPVTIVLPVSTALTPGEGYDVFVLDTSTGTWTSLDEQGIATADGYFLSAGVTHFSTYASSGFNSLNSFGNDIESTGNPATAYANLRDEFINNSGIMGSTKKISGKCFKAVGIEFDVQFSYNGTEGQWTGDTELTGERTSVETNISYSGDYLSAGGQIIYAILIKIYWEEIQCVDKWRIKLEINFNNASWEVYKNYGSEYSATYTIDNYNATLEFDYPRTSSDPYYLHQSIGTITVTDFVPDEICSCETIENVVAPESVRAYPYTVWSDTPDERGILWIGATDNSSTEDLYFVSYDLACVRTKSRSVEYSSTGIDDFEPSEDTSILWGGDPQKAFPYRLEDGYTSTGIVYTGGGDSDNNGFEGTFTITVTAVQ